MKREDASLGGVVATRVVVGARLQVEHGRAGYLVRQLDGQLVELGAGEWLDRRQRDERAPLYQIVATVIRTTRVAVTVTVAVAH